MLSFDQMPAGALCDPGGSASQVNRTTEILAEARRRIYAILAK
jgi:hypothetical protein